MSMNIKLTLKKRLSTTVAIYSVKNVNICIKLTLKKRLSTTVVMVTIRLPVPKPVMLQVIGVHIFGVSLQSILCLCVCVWCVCGV